MNRLRRRLRHVVRWMLVRGFFPSRTFLLGDKTGAEAVIVMCLWNRPSRIDDVLRLLDAQDHPPGVVLMLWNNNSRDHRFYRDAISRFRSGGALREVVLARSPQNVGSIGRFYLARRVGLKRPHTPVITLDDDQDVTPDFVSQTLAAYDQSAVSAWWAWVIEGSYWERRPATVGEHVDHIGPGGSVCCVDVVTDPTFFTTIPEPYRMLDDIWLSYFAVQKGYRLAKLDVDITFVMDETNQFHGQGSLKQEFYEYLKTRR